MGVNYSAIIAIGKTFDDRYDLRYFIEDSGYEFTDEDEEIIDEDGIFEWLYNHETFDGECLDYYSGDYCYLGYSIRCSDPIVFEESFNSAMNLWKKAFPNVEPDVIKTVRVS